MIDILSRFDLPQVHHALEGQLQDGLDAWDALLACFPAGTLSGAPKVRAMEIIDEIEEVRRGVYGGAVGYRNLNGDLDSCIAIRTLVFQDGGYAFQAGAGKGDASRYRGRLPSGWRRSQHSSQDAQQGALDYATGGDLDLLHRALVERGLARMFGMDAVTRRGFTASVDTDVEGKLAAARAALAEHELVYVHIKAPDLFSHDFQPEGKKAFIERVDRALGALEGSGALLALAADHSTSSSTGAHTADPVPVLIHDPRRERTGDPVAFGESACRAGNLPRQTGHEFLLRVLDALQSAP